MSGLSHAGETSLNCSVMEEDWQRGQSYSAQWHSPGLLPQTHRSTAMEAERCGKREARRLLRRFLSGAISQRLDRTGQPSPHHQPSPHPSAAGSKVQRGAVCSQKETGCEAMSPKSLTLGLSEKKSVKTTKLQRFLS